MKEHRHVFKMGPRYVFRLALPACRFVSQSFDTAEDAAFFCDVFKLYLASTYRLTGLTMTRSLAPSRFSVLLGLAGGDAANLREVLPPCCIEYLELSGHETLTEYAAAQAEIKAAK